MDRESTGLRWADENVAAVSTKTVALANRIAKNLGGFGGQSDVMPRETVAAPQMRRQLSLDSVHRSLGGGNLGTQLSTRSPPQPLG